MKLKFIFLSILFLLFHISCENNGNSAISSEKLVSKSISVSGGEVIGSSEISFDFRDKHYIAKRDNGKFSLERHFKDSLGMITDKLSNIGFKRYLNDELIEIPDSMASKYANSVNSVHYFSVLPYGLNDAAVNKKYLGMSKIMGQEYYKIKIYFDEEGGGEDFEDIFLYWINSKNFKVDYLAYSYKTDGGGIRFRKAFNERIIEGIRFVDYKNYKPKSKDADLNDTDVLFENDKMEIISFIELKNIQVQKILDKN